MLYSAAMSACHRFILTAILVAPAALAAPTTVAVMPVEAAEVEVAGRTLHIVLRAAVAEVAGLTEKGPVGMGLDEAKMTFSCFDETAACMAQVGGLLEVERLVWGHVARKGTGWSLKLRHLDVFKAEMVRSEDVTVVDAPDVVDQLARIAEAFVRGDPLPTRKVAQLTVESDPSGALVLLDGREVGTTPLTMATAHGQHRLELRSEGMSSARKGIELAADDTVRIQLVPLGSGGGGDGGGRSNGFWLGVGTGALAATALGVTTYYGIETLRLRQEVQDDLNQGTHERVEPDFDRAKLITNVGWGVAAVSAGLSAYFFLLHDDVTAGIGVRPGGAHVQVTW